MDSLTKAKLLMILASLRARSTALEKEAQECLPTSPSLAHILHGDAQEYRRLAGKVSDHVLTLDKNGVE